MRWLKTLLASPAWCSQYVLLKWKVKRYSFGSSATLFDSATSSPSCPTAPLSFAVFQLAPSEPPTGETDFGFVPLLKTLTSEQRDGAQPAGGSQNTGTLAQQMQYGLLPPTPKAQNANYPAVHGQGGMDLQTFIQLLPTPQAMDGIKSPKWFAGGNPSLPHTIAMLPTLTVNGNNNRAGLSDKSGDGLATAISGQNPGLRLSAAFARWMMGFPPNYDDVSAAPRIEISTSKATATP
jgi:hypothetical protein